MKRGLIISSLLVTLGFAAIPSTMLFQGSVSVGGKAVADGKHKLEIFLCTSAAMSEVSGCTSVFSDSVTSLRGYFSTILGVSTPLPAFDKPYFLELTVDSKKADSRIALTATPYALHATIADSAGKANYADSSSKSGTASLATLATKATFADSTAKSGVSTVADFATKATLADSSGKAGIATLANLATTATLADSAAKAGLARVADTAKALISGVAVKSVNGLTDVVNILAGSNLTAVTSGKSVTIASTLPLSSTAADSLKYSATKIVFAPNTEFITQPSFTISSSETGSYPDHSAIRLLGDSLMLGASYGNPGGSGGIGILLTPTAGGMGRFSSGSGAWSYDSLTITGTAGGVGLHTASASPGGSSTDVSVRVAGTSATISAAIGDTPAPGNSANSGSFTMTGGTISINSANATDTNVVQVLPNVTTFSKIVKLPVMATVAIPTCTAALRGSMVMAMAYAVVGTTIRDRILVCRASTSYPTVGTNTYNWAELGND